jgi:hypothetical protein
MSGNKARLLTNNLYVFKLLEERFKLNRKQLILSAKRDKYYQHCDLENHRLYANKLAELILRKRELNRLLKALGY